MLLILGTMTVSTIHPTIFQPHCHKYFSSHRHFKSKCFVFSLWYLSLFKLAEKSFPVHRRPEIIQYIHTRCYPMFVRCAFSPPHFPKDLWNFATNRIRLFSRVDCNICDAWLHLLLHTFSISKRANSTIFMFVMDIITTVLKGILQVRYGKLIFLTF